MIEVKGSGEGRFCRNAKGTVGFPGEIWGKSRPDSGQSVN
jgi:hypothetical protein